MHQPRSTATCTCPHCIAQVPLRSRCIECRGTLSFKDFHERLQEITTLERWHKLPDNREDAHATR